MLAFPSHDRWLISRILAIVLLWIYWVSCVSSVNLEYLGINPSERQYYEQKIITCKDGSRSFARDLLNDDFCDCPDGTDEPGTSACAEGKFYCTNSGDGLVKIHSSKVNDGICDCCDGSDEYHGKIKCPYTCKHVSKVTSENKKANLESVAGTTQLTSVEDNEKSLGHVIYTIKEAKVLLVLEVVLSTVVFSWFCCHRKRKARFQRRLPSYYHA